MTARDMSSPDARLETMSGGARVSGFTGDIDIQTVSGNLELEATAVTFDITSTSGDVDVTADSASGKISTVSGDVGIIRLAPSPAPAYNIETVSGAITINGQRFEGSVSYASDAPATLNINTISGDISIDASSPNTSTAFDDLRQP
jgi:DUF4097 and DUF4098 domain-containing protein YvlB